MAKQCDLLVIGGGVIGLSCALHILDTQPDLKITIVDAPSKPGIASRAAGGILGPYAEFREHSPIFRMAKASFDYYPEFLQRFNLDDKQHSIIDAEGMLIPANTYEQERAKEIAEHAGRYADVEELDAPALNKLEPHLNLEACPAAFKIPGAMIDSRRLHENMYREARRRGIKLVEATVSGLIRSGSVAEKIVLDGSEEMACRNILLATGVWSAAMGDLIDIDLEIIPVKGHVARFQIADGFLRHVLHSHEVAMGPRRGKGIVVGATVEYVGMDDRVVDDAVAELCYAASRFIPALWDQDLVESWYGFRPKFPDSKPVLGWSSQIENLMIATGHFRSGILLAPETGRIMAAFFNDRSLCDTHAFRPGRLGV